MCACARGCACACGHSFAQKQESAQELKKRSLKEVRESLPVFAYREQVIVLLHLYDIQFISLSLSLSLSLFLFFFFFLIALLL